MSFDAAAIRKQFPILSRPYGGGRLRYLDNAATSQLPLAVIEAVSAFETTMRANVRRGVYRLAERSTEAYETARQSVARYLSVEPAEVVFTGGGTAALNLVAHAFGDTLSAGDEIIVSILEHHSNIVPWQMLRDRRGTVLKVLPVTDDGRIDLDGLEALVTEKCRLIAVTHASNVTGAITDIEPIVAAAHAVGAKVLLDGCQRVPHGPIDVPALGVDFYALSGHKMFAPTGIGVLWAERKTLNAMPPFFGGGEMIRTVTLEQTRYASPPYRFEAGTPPIAQAIGLGAACDWLMGLDWREVSAHETRLTRRLIEALGQREGVRIIGPIGLHGRIGVVSFTMDGAHPHDICQMMDSYGVTLRGGHHCAQPFMDGSRTGGTTRASIALYNCDDDIDALLEGLTKIAERF